MLKPLLLCRVVIRRKILRLDCGCACDVVHKAVDLPPTSVVTSLNTLPLLARTLMLCALTLSSGVSGKSASHCVQWYKNYQKTKAKFEIFFFKYIPVLQ